MADCLHQVGFTEADPAVDQVGIVIVVAGLQGNEFSCCICQFVGVSAHELIERELRQQAIGIV